MQYNAMQHHHSLKKRTPTNDVVSKNITQVLENLLKNYESSQLPSHGKGECIYFPSLNW